MYGNNYITTPGGGPVPPVGANVQSALFRYGEQTLWSTYFYAGGAALSNQVARLFATSRGQTGQNFTTPLSAAETNLKTPGMVPAGVGYDVFGIAVQMMQFTGTSDGATQAGPIATAAEIGNLQNVLNNGTVVWDFTQTRVDVAPIALVGQGGGIFGAVSTTASSTTLGAMNNGAGGVFMYRQHPVALPGQSVFAIELVFGSRAPVVGTNAISLRTVLLGFYRNLIEIG